MYLIIRVRRENIRLAMMTGFDGWLTGGGAIILSQLLHLACSHPHLGWKCIPRFESLLANANPLVPIPQWNRTMRTNHSDCNHFQALPHLDKGKYSNLFINQGLSSSESMVPGDYCALYLDPSRVWSVSHRAGEHVPCPLF